MSKNEITLRTDKGEYIGGETIFGTVFLRVVTPFQANSLFLEIKGYEKVFWEYHDTESYEEDGQTKFRTIVKDHKGSNDFFKDNFTLINYPGGFPIGDWSYPFQYRLPEKLPGVFEKKRKNGLKINSKIRYKIKVTCDVHHGSDLKFKQHLVIHERLDKSIQPAHHTKTMTVMTCCCIPRGPVTCESYVDKNAYMSGETAQAHVKVANNSAVKVNHFTSKLIRTISFNDGHGHTNKYRDIVAQERYDGTEPHTEKASDIPLRLLGKKSHPLQASTESKMVKCEYQIMIEMDIPWAPDLEIFVPIKIYAPMSPSWLSWSPPQWIASAQIQQVSSQVAVPQEIIDARMHHGYFQ